ncbi:MAG: multicopper oxidase family protein [Gemmatimonadetes bacterium]|nr:multicopper oxidase family protein [Gemmatimonadota bacterium]
MRRTARIALLAAVLAALSAGRAAAQQQTPKPPEKATPAMPGMHGMHGDSAHHAGAPAAPGAKPKPGARPDAGKPAGPTSHEGMAGMEHGAMSMPIPMPAGMPMMPGLMGLSTGLTPFLPGAGVDPASLPAARPTEVAHLEDGDTLELTAMLVRRTVRGRTFTMYGFNGQVPGPLIRVPQNATITVRFRNRIDLPSAVHWHGVRLDNASDGVPGVTQAPVAPGDSFVYTVHFPDAGIYWYHPHVREDIEQAMGLFGNMLVDAPDRDYYSPANREQVLILDDLLMNGDTLIPFGTEGPDFALMGRVGNVILVNGEPRYSLRVKRGEVVRFYLTNASSSRTYNLSFGGAAMKVVAADVSRFEREERVESVVLAPAERYVVQVRFDRPGRYALVNAVQAINHFRGEFEPEVDTLGIVTVEATPATPDYSRAFATLRANAAVSRDIAKYRPYFDKEPAKRLTLTVEATGLPLATVQFMSIDTAYYAPVEWVDGMPDMNWLSTSRQVRWILRDDATGKENMDIDWHVPQGSIVKLRIFNDPRSFHPMQHPIHLHGQRMLVVARDGVRTKNLVWKDTALIPVGSTVDLLIDASNPGDWMLHCHIAEHLGSGMMALLHVDPSGRP